MLCEKTCHFLPYAESAGSVCRSGSFKGGVAESSDGQQKAQEGNSDRKACHLESTQAQAASSAEASMQTPDEDLWGRRRLRSADALGRLGSVETLGRRGSAADSEDAGQGLRATLYDSLMSHTRLLRSSSR